MSSKRKSSQKSDNIMKRMRLSIKQDKTFNQNMFILEEMKKMSMAMSKMMKKISNIEQKVARVETIVENDNKKDMEIEDLNYKLQTMELTNGELMSKIDRDENGEVNCNYYA